MFFEYFFSDKNYILRDTDYGKYYYDIDIEKNWNVEFTPQKAEVLLTEINEVANRLQVPFFLVYGTALGAYRDKTFIAYDCDIDIGIMQKDRENLLRLLKELVLEKNYKVYKISHLQECIGLIKDNIPVEFSIFVEYGDYYTFNKVKFDRIPKKFFMEFEEISFLGQRYKVLSPIEEYLQYQYGKDWRMPIEDFYNPYKRYIQRPLAKVLTHFTGDEYAQKLSNNISTVIQKIYRKFK